MTAVDLRQRSIRTLAWLGDAEFEREVRRRLSIRGDFSTDRLDKLRARIVNAEAQATLLAELIAAGALREGDDDMPSHVRSVLTQTSLSFPVAAGTIPLGTWQGIYVWEHRHAAHGRRVTITVQGETRDADG